MKVLLIGGGGSTHALVWKLLDDSRVRRVYCAPGNGGTALMAHNVPYTPGQPKDLATWAWEQRIDLTLIADDIALVDGVAQAFRLFGLTILAPEGKFLDACTSRAWARALFARLDIPTLPGLAFGGVTVLSVHVTDKPWPLRLRPDGAHTSNWTAIVNDAQEAHQAAQTILGESLAIPTVEPRVLVEEYVAGIEVSASAFVMGADVGPVALSYIHHHREDEGQGPVTDGLGAYSPLWADPSDLTDLAARIRSEGMEPLARTLDYRGIMHLDVLLTKDGHWRALGLRATFGDPEAQVVLPRLEGSLLDALRGVPGPWRDEVTCGVVLAMDSYPSAVDAPSPITGLDTLDPGVLVFHGGTALPQGKLDLSKGFSPLVATGGRVLTVVGRGADHAEARGRAHPNVGRIQFQGSRYRKDIARRPSTGEGAADIARRPSH